LAVPVASEFSCDEMRRDFDDVLCAVTPLNFYAVGQWYQEFSQTTDEKVRELLAQTAARVSQIPEAA
jgi:predicted phosphoribosyltransferase